MHGIERRRNGGWILACLMIIMSFTFLMGVKRGPALEAVSPLLAGKGEYRIYRGAEEMKGGQIFISRTQLLQGTLLLVDREHPLPDDFLPPNTRTLRAMVGSYLPVWDDTALLPEAVYALCEMKLDYSLDSGITFTRGTLSGAQLDAWRKQTFDDYSRVYSLEEALQLALSHVPGAMESEHRLGYALDAELHPPLSMGQADPLMRNATGIWLKGHMAEYGWIYRFDSEGGGTCRGIHLRYVGKAHALMMEVLHVNLEEYWDILRRERALTLCKGETPIVRVFCVPGQQMLISVPSGYEYAASLDNTGWAAAAIWETGVF